MGEVGGFPDIFAPGETLNRSPAAGVWKDPKCPGKAVGLNLFANRFMFV